mmetsp:Transcript_74630/g.167137  ORF Transcript_74630/g.167137 Transcript_74630/m.167137 type:complete len:205 (-) Transcript_74630:18-632(-)
MRRCVQPPSVRLRTPSPRSQSPPGQLSEHASCSAHALLLQLLHREPERWQQIAVHVHVVHAVLVYGVVEQGRVVDGAVRRIGHGRAELHPVCVLVGDLPAVAAFPHQDEASPARLPDHVDVLGTVHHDAQGGVVEHLDLVSEAYLPVVLLVPPVAPPDRQLPALRGHEGPEPHLHCVPVGDALRRLPEHHHGLAVRRAPALREA